MVNSEVWYEVVLIMFVHIGLEFLISCCFGLQAFWEISTVASWDRSLLHKTLLSQFATSLFEVILSGNNVMIDSKVWNEVVFIMLIHISLEFLFSGGLSLKAFWEVSAITSWDRLFLSKLSSCFFEVILSSDDIMINTEVWNKVVLIVFIHISLELLIGGGLSFEALWEVSTIACWNGSLVVFVVMSV